MLEMLKIQCINLSIGARNWVYTKLASFIVRFFISNLVTIFQIILKVYEVEFGFLIFILVYSILRSR